MRQLALAIASFERYAKLIHSAVTTPANVRDATVLPELLHGNETRIWGDQAYRGQRAIMCQRAPRALDFTKLQSGAPERRLVQTFPSQSGLHRHLPTGYCSRLHSDDDRVATKAQHQSLPFRYQMHDHAISVLQPEITGAFVSESDAIAALGIGSRKRGDITQVVDVTMRLDPGSSNAANAKPSHGEGVCVAMIE